MTLKADIIKESYSMLRISGLTVVASPKENQSALMRLEDMVSELEGRNICIDYNFQENPNPSDQLGTLRKYHYMLKTNLALRLAADFGKVVPPSLSTMASQSLSSVSSMVAAANIRQVQPSLRSPIGSGNHRNTRYRRFQHPDPLPPNQCATNKILVGSTQDYDEPFNVYLGNENIASYEITADSGLSIISNSNTDKAISYRINAVDNVTHEVWQQVKITITTDSGRIEARVINFEIGGY